MEEKYPCPRCKKQISDKEFVGGVCHHCKYYEENSILTQCLKGNHIYNNETGECFSCGAEELKEKINHPSHYNKHPSGIECIDIIEHMGFNLGNAIKYIWREDLKENGIKDLKKALWYINREIEKRKK